MNIFTRFFKKPKPKNTENFRTIQYLYEQTQALQFEYFCWYQNEITDEEYIIACDVIIDKMYQRIRETNLEYQPELMKQKKQRRLKKS